MSTLFFFPSAATDRKDYTEMITDLKSSHTVYIFDGDYHGQFIERTKYEKKHNLSSDIFVKKFLDAYAESIKADPHQYCILAQSFGCIHAWRIKQLLPEVRVVMVAPPLSEDHFHRQKRGNILLRGIIHSRLIQSLIDRHSVKLAATLLDDSSVSRLQKAFQKTGILSFAHCLQEISRYGVVSAEAIPEDIVMIFGRHDPFLKALCIQTHLRQRARSHIYEADHNILQSSWGVVREKILHELG